jgi:hypothetical protein
MPSQAPLATVTTQEFAATIKAKYPAYASVPDADLAAKMLEKYPIYRDRVVDFQSSATAPEPSLMESAGAMAGDLVTGAAKGLGQTAANLGRGVHMIPGVSRAVDALYGAPVSQPSFQEADRVLAPTNTPQAIGKGAEQLAEFFVPAGAVNRAAQGLTMGGRAAVEGLAGAGIAGAQGASPVEMAASGALSAIPGALPVKRLRASIAEHLKSKAAKRVTEGLGATTKRNKVEAQRIAGEFADRGLGGSVESLSEQSATQVDDLGREMGKAIKGPIGQERRATAPIVESLEKAKGKLTTQKLDGSGELVVTDKPQWEALGKLQEVVQEYGDEISVEQINALKKIYARVTSRSGGYAEKAGEILNTAPEAAKSFAGILRKEENGVEALSKLNKEFRFWKSLNTVTKATVDRRSSQGKGLTASLAPVIGAVGGGASGDSLTERASNAIIGGVAGRKLTTALQSPQWKFVRARYANQLADAIAGSNPERIGQVVGKILAAEAAHAH